MLGIKDSQVFLEANVQTSAELAQQNWWADNDMPVRSDSQVTFLIDGRHTMWTMCLHFLKARRSIHLANWGITATMPLVRGSDHRAGPDGSPEQEALLAELKTAGLSNEDIQFWVTHELTVQNVLGYAVSKGIEVKVLLWACPELFSHYSPKTAHEQLCEVGVNCILDDSANHLPHPSESLHQKISIVDSAYAFVGGIDPLIELSGDFDRWDTPWHSFSSSLRANPKDREPHCWHDAHAIIEGTAARDVEFNFYQRWNSVINRRNLDQDMLLSEPVRNSAQEPSTRLVQVTRTIPFETYEFAPGDGIQSIAQSYANAFSNTKNFLYIENQYLWLHAFIGVEIADFGPSNPDMELNMDLLAQSLERGAHLILILPDHPNVGRSFTDAGINHLRKLAPQATKAGRIQVFCLAHSHQREGNVLYRPVYVHAKIAIIDDGWSTIGSANLNNRGMRDDAEINVAVLDKDFARDLRILLWAEHLGMLNEEEQFIVSRYLGRQPQYEAANSRARDIWQRLTEQLGDFATGLRLLKESAQTNLERYRNGELLTGHLFPYLTHEEARHIDLKFHESHGLFENPD